MQHGASGTRIAGRGRARGGAGHPRGGFFGAAQRAAAEPAEEGDWRLVVPVRGEFAGVPLKDDDDEEEDWRLSVEGMMAAQGGAGLAAEASAHQAKKAGCLDRKSTV